MAEELTEFEKLVQLNGQPWIVRHEPSYRFYIRPAEGNPVADREERSCLSYKHDDIDEAYALAELMFKSLPKKTNEGRWKKVTPHLANIAWAMRLYMDTTSAGKAIGLRREAICIAIRATEALMGVKLFSRSRGIKSRWGLLNSPEAQAAWRIIEETKRD